MIEATKKWALSISAKQIWILLLVILLTGPAGFVGAWWWMKQPPVIVYDTYEEDAMAVSGGYLSLIVTKIDNSPCMTGVARWLWRFDPLDPLPDLDPRKRRVWKEIISTPHSPPTVGKVTTYRLLVPLPEGLEPDDWYYQGQAIDTCVGPLGGGPRFSKSFKIRIEAP